MTSGKVRYIGVLEFFRLALDEVALRLGTIWMARYVAHQVYYSLIGREYEWELMPLGLDQRVGAVVWSPLGMGPADGEDSARPAVPARADCRTRSSSLGRGVMRNIYIASSMRLDAESKKRARPCPSSR